MIIRRGIDLGHRCIGLVGGPAYASSARNRRRRYEAALRAADLPVEEALVAGDSFSMADGERAGRALLDREAAARPTAIFAINDNTAIGVMAAAHALGLRVPQDLSLVGYNDIPVISRLPVPLTSVRVPFEQIAATALDLLAEALAGQPPRAIVTAPTLIPRASTTRPQP